MKKVIIAILGILVVFLGLLFLKPIRKDIYVEYKTTNINILGTEFTAQIADNDPLRELGLSYRDSLDDNSAMLFVFEKPSVYKFWMKDMKFPIDMIWLDENKEVIHIEKDVKPETFPESFGPNKNAKYIIEIKANRVDQIGLSVGDILEF
jgi:uncharacterized membrane protein (UPF0127 family)